MKVLKEYLVGADEVIESISNDFIEYMIKAFDSYRIDLDWNNIKINPSEGPNNAIIIHMVVDGIGEIVENINEKDIDIMRLFISDCFDQFKASYTIPEEIEDMQLINVYANFNHELMRLHTDLTLRLIFY